MLHKLTQEYKDLRSEEVSKLEENLPFYSRASYQHEVDIEK
jgi:hypothetical protein